TAAAEHLLQPQGHSDPSDRRAGRGSGGRPRLRRPGGRRHPAPRRPRARPPSHGPPYEVKRMNPIDLDHVLTVLGAAAWSTDEQSRARVAGALALTVYDGHTRDQGTPYLEHPLAIITLL